MTSCVGLKGYKLWAEGRNSSPQPGSRRVSSLLLRTSPAFNDHPTLGNSLKIHDGYHRTIFVNLAEDAQSRQTWPSFSLSRSNQISRVVSFALAPTSYEPTDQPGGELTET